MFSKNSQPIPSFAIPQDDQDSPSRILNPLYYNSLPKACDSESMQMQSISNILVPSPSNKHLKSSIGPILNDKNNSFANKDKKPSDLAQFQGKNILPEPKISSSCQKNKETIKSSNIILKGNDAISDALKPRQPLQAVKIDRFLTRLQKKEVLDKMKSNLNMHRHIIPGNNYKSVGQKISVKRAALIKEKKQKRPFFDNDIQKSIHIKSQSHKLSSTNKSSACKSKSQKVNNQQPKYPKITKNIIEKNSKVSLNSRKRKSPDQVKVLRQEFQKQPNWTKSILEKISQMTGLQISQVYKWGWDQSKKEGIQRILDQSLHKLYSEQSDSDINDDDDDDEIDYDDHDFVYGDNQDQEITRVGKNQQKKIEQKESKPIKRQNQSKRKEKKPSKKNETQKQKGRKNYRLPMTDQFGGYAKRHYSNEFLQFSCDFKEELYYQLAKQNVVLSPNGQMGEFRTRLLNNNNSSKSDNESDDSEDSNIQENEKKIPSADEKKKNLKERSKKYRKVSGDMISDILSSTQTECHKTNSNFQQKQTQSKKVEKSSKVKGKKSPSTNKKGKKGSLKRKEAICTSQKKSMKQNQKNSIRLSIQNNQIKIEASLSIQEWDQNKEVKDSHFIIQQEQQVLPQYYPHHPSSIYHPNSGLYHRVAYYHPEQSYHHHHHHHQYPTPSFVDHNIILGRNKSSSDDNENINSEEEQQSNQNLFEEILSHKSIHSTPRNHHHNHHHLTDYNYPHQYDQQQQQEHEQQQSQQQLQSQYNINSYIHENHQHHHHHHHHSQLQFNTPHFQTNSSQQMELLNLDGHQDYNSQQEQNRSKLKDISEARRASRVTNIANSVPNYPLNYDLANSPTSVPLLHGQMSAPHVLYCNKYELNSIFGSKQDGGDKNELMWNEDSFSQNNDERIDNFEEEEGLDNDDGVERYFISSPDLEQCKRRDFNKKNNRIIPFSGRKNQELKVNGFLQKQKGENDDDVEGQQGENECRKQLNLDQFDFEREEKEGQQSKKKDSP